ncbi:isoleucine--tRNA ligase [bacterium]|nr:isoleucine--tRNA ligase [bacterium]
MDYSKTINLPKTAFPMKANLPSREPEFQKKWDEMGLYYKILQRRRGQPIFILHDGPPYSNGDIHMGHALNKILKDLIVRYKMLRGFYAPFVPGWDNHGMPIEKEVQEEMMREESTPTITLIRQRCRAFAARFVEIQKQQFKRLGIIGDWDNPYLTMDKEYEADLVRIFGELYFKGYIYRALKPILWCPRCQTALAEAEIEYHEKVSPSIWVEFPLKDGKGKIDDASAIIWTTTPWTLPGNVAIMIHPDFHYVVVEVDDGKSYLVCKEALERVKEELGWSKAEIKKEFKGRQLEGVVFSHPFIDRESPLVLSEFVTAEQGSGLVHSAPGHGEEDYIVGRSYNLPIISPVDGEGRFSEEAGELAGLFVMKEGNEAVMRILREKGFLLKSSEITHDYPHCWRCKNPLIFRATVQWFMDIDHQGHREKCLKEIEKTQWIPPQMINRIYNMVKTRPDWCLSRQRAWGVGIPAFYCEHCEEVIITPEIVERVYNLIKERGSDSWFELPSEEILPPGFTCPKCGGTAFRKEKDILDVWFDSGSSHLCVLERREDHKWPADIYLEGSDQHRGWFNSSLMIAVAIKGRAPYNTVITNGWVLDAEGHPMHKSLGNVISPLEVVERYGADVLRLWISSLNCTEDVHMSFEIVDQIAESYRKIRNTLRFILGNLYDFDPAALLSPDELFSLDKFMLSKLQGLVNAVTQAFDAFQFHRAYHILLDFCVNWLSAFYLDVLKDRLYIYPAGSKERLSAQTALFHIAKTLTIIFAPIIPHTAEEVFQHLPQWEGKPESVHLSDWPEPDSSLIDEKLEEKWEKVLALRRKIYKKIEEERSKGVIANPLEASVEVYLPEEYLSILDQLDSRLSDILITSNAEYHPIEEGAELDNSQVEDIKVVVRKAKGRKCARCWQIKESVGEDAEYPDLCERCASILRSGEVRIC